MYQYQISEEACCIISCETMIGQILADCAKGVKAGKIARKFHNTLAEIIAEVCIRIREKTGITETALGGGVFQNLLLADLAEKKLCKAGFLVYRNHEFPANDGGISLGQAAICYQEEQDVSIRCRNH